MIHLRGHAGGVWTLQCVNLFDDPALDASWTATDVAFMANGIKDFFANSDLRWRLHGGAMGATARVMESVAGSQSDDLPTVPVSPAGLALVAGDASAALTWDAPDLLGVPVITDYETRHRVTGADAWGGWTSTGSILQAAALAMLVNDTEYEVQVRGVSWVGNGDPSQSAYVTPEV